MTEFRVLLSLDGLLGAVRELAVRANKFYYKFSKPEGTKVANEDWDNLIILDGCRYDMFRDESSLGGRLEKRRSLGSSSGEFLQENFSGDVFHDIVYVSANPWVPEMPPGTFHDVINLLETHWDEDLQTVHPSDVVKEAVEARERYPNKRLVVHFMQPHHPFIGEFGQKIDSNGAIIQNAEDETGSQSIWVRLQFGLDETSENEAIEAYRENINLVSDHAEELLERLPGRSVVTSDHGNMIGDRMYPIPAKGFGHPGFLYVPELVEVPWLVVDGSDRPEIGSEPPKDRQDMDKELLNERLDALGYR